MHLLDFCRLQHQGEPIMSKTVLEMAREAGFEVLRGPGLRPHVPEDVFAGPVKITEEINRFAELVRADAIADERTACLAIADDCADSDMHASMAANFIRARSNT